MKQLLFKLWEPIGREMFPQPFNISELTAFASKTNRVLSTTIIPLQCTYLQDQGGAYAFEQDVIATKLDDKHRVLVIKMTYDPYYGFVLHDFETGAFVRYLGGFNGQFRIIGNARKDKAVDLIK